MSDASGLNWTVAFTDSGQPFYRIVADNNGTRIAAVNGTAFYYSGDGGATWTARRLGAAFGLAASADLATLAIGAYVPSYFSSYVSSDAGMTWVQRTLVGDVIQALSPDGKNALAFDPSGRLSLSFDTGATWSPAQISISQSLIAASSDLNKLLTTDSSGHLNSLTLLRTGTGADGAIEGGQLDSIELQYIGGGQYIARSSASASGGFIFR